MSEFSKKDGMQVLRAAYSDDLERLKVDATFSEGIEVSLSSDTDSVAIGDGANTLTINPDGSINTNLEGSVEISVSAADGDNVAISDGTNTLAVNPDGSLNVVTDSNGTEATRIDEASSTVTYIGKAAVGSDGSSAVWQISRITITGTVTIVEFANGSDAYDQIWDNRASLTYE